MGILGAREASADVFIRAWDGYDKPASATELAEDGAYLAFGDADLSHGDDVRWAPLGARHVDPGPLYLVFTKLPRRVRLKGASGATAAHNPFLLDAVTLLPGGFVNFLASFTGKKAVRFTAEVFAGPGPL